MYEIFNGVKSMERLGISSACFYPQTTEDSFMKICKNGIKCAELFFNSTSELDNSYIDKIIEIKDFYNVEIPSVHPILSFAESYFLFSSYERRFYDILDFYRKFFEITAKLNSDIFVIHGIKKPGSISDEEYFNRFGELIRIGKEFNVKVCQENVVNHRSENCRFLNDMKSYIGDDFGVVLDIKQVRRTKEDVFDFVNSLNTSIKHIHISDENDERDCIPPTFGKFNFRQFFDALAKVRYDGRFIIELYESSYKNEDEIYFSYRKINEILVDYFN